MYCTFGYTLFANSLQQTKADVVQTDGNCAHKISELNNYT